ncbi:hypothetical protein HOLleu_00183 [Holothuria leucospilota]|uniref:Transposase n=1 Tax=Holothuria leucospilota TaxID=206669 RepID=A0A9Q1HFN7_HOLLE|nr:hypothetical protein HOLleu_00183 [Holothuria leucospilota]
MHYFICPGYSAYNPIEHLWAPLSKHLTGAILPDHLDGELAPTKQTHLSAEQLRKKEGDVFDNAMETLNGYWEGKEFDGHHISLARIQMPRTPTTKK